MRASSLERAACRTEKKRNDYAFWRQFNEKPNIIPGCPGACITTPCEGRQPAAPYGWAFFYFATCSINWFSVGHVQRHSGLQLLQLDLHINTQKFCNLLTTAAVDLAVRSLNTESLTDALDM